MTTPTRKPSWIASLMHDDAAQPSASAAPSPSQVAAPVQVPKAPEPRSAEEALASIAAGTGTLAQDPQSGSIMKLLSENGFAQKILEGSKSGHAYSIIHNAPSTEFLLIDQWDDAGRTRKAYQAFTIKTEAPQKVSKNLAKEERHPALKTVDDALAAANSFIKSYKAYKR